MAQIILNNGKKIHVRDGSSNWKDIQNMYVRNDAGTDWKFVQRSWVKDDSGVWKLVWDPMIMFTHSGEVQNFTVPYGVDKLYCRIWGGGGNNLGGINAGRGGFTEVELDMSDLSISGGDTLQIVVGGGHRQGQVEQFAGLDQEGTKNTRITDDTAQYIIYGGGGVWCHAENPANVGAAGGGMSGIFKSGAGLQKWYWPNFWTSSRGLKHGPYGGRFYTNPNAGITQGVVQTGPGTDQLAIDMVANVLAVAGGGGGGNNNTGNADGGGLTGGRPESSAKRATQTSGGGKDHSPWGPGCQWWGGCGGDHHNSSGGGGGWFGGGQGEYTVGGGSGHIPDIAGVTGTLFENYHHDGGEEGNVGFPGHYQGVPGENGTYWTQNPTIESPPSVETVGYKYSDFHASQPADSSLAGHGLVTIRFRPYTVGDEIGDIGP